MLTRRILRLARTSQVRPMTGTTVRLYNADLDQSRHSGHAARDQSKSAPLDAANPEKGKKAPREGLTGNAEGVGFADQVGSQSASGGSTFGGYARKPESAEGVSGQENVTPPSFGDAIKEKLGFGTTAGEAKQNRGGGKGVTGTGRVALEHGKRTMHTSALTMADKTQGQAPASSRQPKESTHGQQNEHLKHKKSSATPDSGKGNAAANPTLPSRQAENSRMGKAGGGTSQHRSLSTSARASSEHSAESYFKEVDTSKPPNPKVHQVDASSDAPPVARANEKVTTGEPSKEGQQTKAYETVSQHDQPYGTPSAHAGETDAKLGYGGTAGKAETSKPDEGPEGKNAGGRKPEGRS